MKKKIALFLILVSPAFADVYEYSLDDANTSNCLDMMTVVDNGSEMSLETSNELGMFFNKDSSDESLVIENINEGSQTIRSTNSSHGTKSKTIYKAVRKNNKLVVSKVIKFGSLGLDKSESELSLEFNNKKLNIDIYRSYNETFGSDWEKKSYCSYSLIK